MDVQFAGGDVRGNHGRLVQENVGGRAGRVVRESALVAGVGARGLGGDARRGGVGNVAGGGGGVGRGGDKVIPCPVGDVAEGVLVARGEVFRHGETGVVERPDVLLRDEHLDTRGVAGMDGSRAARVVADGESDFRSRRHVAHRHLEVEALRASFGAFERDDAARENVVRTQRDGDGRAGAGGSRGLFGRIVERGEGGVPAVFGGDEAQDHVGVSGLSGMDYHLVDVDGFAVEDAARFGHERRIRQHMVGDVHLEVGRRGAAPALKLAIVDRCVRRRKVAEIVERRDAGGAAVCPFAAVFVRVGIHRRGVVLEILPQRLAGVVDGAGGGGERDERADREKHRAKYGAAQNGTKDGAA